MNYYEVLQQLYQFTNAQHKKISMLEKSLADLQKEIDYLKKRPAISVERIEYKLDQLKVETLEGTLHIGINPAELAELEDVAITKAMKGHNPEMVQETIQHMNGFLDAELRAIIHENAIQLQRSLDEPYYELIKQDMIKQLPKRIEFYYQQFAKNHPDERELKELVESRVKEDIRQAIFHFINSLPNDQKGGGKHESSSH
ncbi:MAG TPA: spore germination protein GerPC [Chondromyces sp.]|nr:spore germination protein GerPC [Chondromyces sp.]